MMRIRVLLPLLLLAACATPPAIHTPAPPPPPPPLVIKPALPPSVYSPPPNAEFARWIAGYRQAALARGASPQAIETLLAGVQPIQRVIDLDRRQPGDSKAGPARFDAYLARQVDAARINGGVAAASRVSGRIAAVQAKTGVPGEIILAIWGLETAYGKVTGDFDVPAALATLAWEGRRSALFTRELDATLAIVEKGLAPRSSLRGSWAGAMGQPQFLPSSYLAYGVDGDGDGRADIWTSEADTLASIGNYLSSKGWVAGLSWGNVVSVPAAFDRAQVKNPETPKTCARPLEKHSRWLPISQWKAWGLTSAAAFPPDATLATLIEPDGPGQGAYLATANYRVIMEYNCSNFYALSVALLGDATSNRPR
jgi:membrane-bound lytic murein transglycosylase B